VLIDSNGQKLSKQTLAKAVDNNKPAQVLIELLHLLQQNPPLELQYYKASEILTWAIEHWQLKALKNQQAFIIE
jgi:glutamyl-Q tRNA(Asp) synthetase